MRTFRHCKNCGLLCLLVCVCACSAKYSGSGLPDWVSNPLKNCSKDFVCAVGEGVDVLSASANARNEVAKQFSVKINSNAVFGIEQENNVDRTTANYSLNEDVDEVLNGVLVKEIYCDKRGAYYAFAIIDKEKIIQTLSSETNEVDKKIKSALSVKPTPVGTLKRLVKQRDEMNKKYIALTGRSLPGGITDNDIRKAKGVANVYKIDIANNSELNIKDFIQSEIVSNFDKISKDAQKVISGKVNITKQYLNVDGFEKYEVAVVLSCKDGNKKLGSIEIIKSEIGRSKRGVIDKVKDAIFAEIDEKIDSLLM